MGTDAAAFEPPPAAVGAARYLVRTSRPTRRSACRHPSRPFLRPIVPLHLTRSPSNRLLWDTFSARFLDALEGRSGPGFPAHAWLAHRTHRDLLLEAAERRGVEGWLGSPFSFLADLPERFGFAGRPAGLLTRRRLLASVAAREGRRHEVHTGETGGGMLRGHMLDGLFSELLPEGVGEEELAGALAEVADDDFARRRNAWVVGVFSAYREALRERGLFDPRSVPAWIAERIRSGALTDALDGARELHLYGIHSLRTRTSLARALAGQDEVRATVYLPHLDTSDEWDAVAGGGERLGERPSPAARVQPAPDAEQELRWVAGEVKRLLRERNLEPRRIAVVARSGFEDTRRAHRALTVAGIPATARIRTSLVEVPALRFVLELFRGAAEAWPYRALRNVLGSPYVDCPVELRFLDTLAERRRMSGLGAWERGLEALRRELLDHEDPSEGRRALAARVQGSSAALATFAASVEGLGRARTEEAWIDATLGLLEPGILAFRRRLSRPVGERWDVVRLDQRGVVQLRSLLGEWRRLELSRDAIPVGDWHALLRRLLEGHDLALSTPLQQGVQVLEAQEAALTPFDHVFLIHANDGVFPRAVPSGGVLTEDERTRLRGRLPLAHRELDLQRERTLWNAVTGADAVTVSYRTTDAAGQPLLSSLLVPEHEDSVELSRTWRLPEEVLNAEELLLVRARELAVAEADVGEGRAPILLPEPRRLSVALLHAMAETHRRSQAAARTPAELRASPWSGFVRDPEVLAHLAERFGPARVWSAGQLETYAACPFLFLTDRVLRLQGTQEAEEETSALTFGSVAHRLLERFHHLAIGRLPATLDREARALFERAVATVRTELDEGDAWLGSPVLWRHTFRDICDRVREYLEVELPRLAKDGHEPLRTEYAFGFDDDAVELLESDLDGQAVRLLLRGRIDRVDRQPRPDGDLHHVVDYKTSTVPAAGGYHDGATLQAALYLSAYAAAEGAAMAKGGYRPIKNPGSGGSRCLVKWGDQKHASALAIAASIPDRIRAGHFEPVQAASAQWRNYQPGIEVTRGRGQLRDGHRFLVASVPEAPEGTDG